MLISWPLSINASFVVMFAYVLIYYGLARAVLAKICSLDRDYFDITDERGRLPFGMATSVAIWDMVWDGDLPGSEYGQFVRVGLYAVRALFVCYIPLGCVLFYYAE